MPKTELDVGSYVGVESFKNAVTGLDQSNRDAMILEHLLAASRDFERDTFRHYFPVLATNDYRWPPEHVAASWRLWLEDDLLSASLVQVAATGQNAAPGTITSYFLEPQFAGPPYNRLEVDLSSSGNDVFQSGPTPQRSVAITGQWGYCATTVSAGLLAAGIGSSDTSLTCTVPSRIDQGDVLLIDSEAIYVDAGRGLTVQRGVNGTTPAAHLINAPISKYQAPADVRRVVRADAISSFAQDLASWGRSIGNGEMAVESQGKQMKSLRERVVEHYARRRTAAV